MDKEIQKKYDESMSSFERAFWENCSSRNSLNSAHRKKRKCSKCGIQITSQNYGIRLCGVCRTQNSKISVRKAGTDA